ANTGAREPPYHLTNPTPPPGHSHTEGRPPHRTKLRVHDPRDARLGDARREVHRRHCLRRKRPPPPPPALMARERPPKNPHARLPHDRDDPRPSSAQVAPRPATRDVDPAGH